MIANALTSNSILVLTSYLILVLAYYLIITLTSYVILAQTVIDTFPNLTLTDIFLNSQFYTWPYHLIDTFPYLTLTDTCPEPTLPVIAWNEQNNSFRPPLLLGQKHKMNKMDKMINFDSIFNNNSGSRWFEDQMN